MTAVTGRSTAVTAARQLAQTRSGKAESCELNPRLRDYESHGNTTTGQLQAPLVRYPASSSHSANAV
jgi:hypothetical protein